MKHADDELDEFAKRTLNPLRDAPPLDPQAASLIKARYLQQASSLKAALPASQGSTPARRSRAKGFLWNLQPNQMLKFLLAGVIAVAVLLVGSSITVSAAQDSLPGQALYPIKSLSENIQLSLTSNPQTRLDLVLKFTNRRIDEISTLVASGKSVDDRTSERFQQELDTALQLASQMNDTQIQNALGLIKDHARNQGMTVERLINSLPPQAEPAMLHLQDRLNEQVQISTLGEADPKEFRQQVKKLQMERLKNKYLTETEEPGSISPEDSATPASGQENNMPGGNMPHSTDTPSHGGSGNGQDQQPGNSNHGQNPTHSPKP